MRWLLLTMLVPAAAAQQHALARLEPKSEVAIEFVADTDGDGRAELVLVAADGQLDRWGLRAENGGSGPSAASRSSPTSA